MAVERRLTELIGPLGGKLHTGRSRNDQVATDLALFVRARADRARELIAALMERLLELAEAHRDWRMPGYTHLQRAQPVYLGHHLLAYFWMLSRDATRFAAARDGGRRRCRSAPGRSRASTGTSTATPTAAALGFGAPVAELDRRGLQPRLRARLPLRGHRLRDPPLAARRGGRDLVEPGVRLLRARRRLLLRLEPDAPEEEPRRGRAAAGEGAAGRRRTRDPGRGPARAAARLLQGPSGGQGGAVRRGRHGRALPRGRRADARRAALRPRAAGRGGRATSSSRPPTSPTCWCARGCRSARLTAWSAAWCATALENGLGALGARPRAARRPLRAARRRVLRGPARGRLAGVQALGRRDLVGPARRAARRRSRGPRPRFGRDAG